MKNLLCYTLFALMNFFSQAQMPQYNIDSLMSLRNLDSLNGKIKTYYSPGNKARALKFQGIIENATSYYSKKYNKPFVVKLAVLDSTQWLNEILPWGYNFVNNGWAILTTGMSPESYFSVISPKEKRPVLDSVLKSQHLTAEEFMYINDIVIALHELGHHYLMRIRNITAPGMWFNEVGADYFAYNFFEKIKLPQFRQTIPVVEFTANNNIPHHRELIAWDTLNVKAPLEDLTWFDAETQLLVTKIYSLKGELFLDEFIRKFENKKLEDLTLEYTIGEVNKLSGNVVTNWRNEMRKR